MDFPCLFEANQVVTVALDMKISDETRRRIVEAYLEQDISINDIARTFGVKVPTVYAILKIFQQEGRIEKKLKGGPGKKSFTQEQADYVKECIARDCSVTLSA